MASPLAQAPSNPGPQQSTHPPAPVCQDVGKVKQLRVAGMRLSQPLHPPQLVLPLATVCRRQAAGVAR